MRVDKARHQQLLGRVDGLIDAARTQLGDRLAPLDRMRDAATNGRDHTVDDEEIGNGGKIHVAGVIVDASILDEDDAAGARVGHEQTSVKLQ